jgi:activator of HSP90 ATPase
LPNNTAKFAGVHDKELRLLTKVRLHLRMKNFKKYYTLQADPDEVYLALTRADTIQLWTGEQAEMSTEPGTEFSLWDGSIVGKES